MAIINFKEIPEAHVASGNQDRFEMFAREFFSALGFEIISSPDRGPDDGKDLIILERHKGSISDVEIKWLVSCKHKAHSGNSVSKDDEADILDRVQQHNCDGFIAFYSTLPSSSLNRKFQSYEDRLRISIFDSEKIEKNLIENVYAYGLIKRFFPESFAAIDTKMPSNIFDEYVPLVCNKCGKDLLSRDVIEHYKAVFVMVEESSSNYEKKKYTNIYCACKGECDRSLEMHYHSLDRSTGWDDISDHAIPYNFIKFQMSVMNRLRNGKDEYTDEAYESLKDYIIAMSQIVMKNQIDKDIERIRSLQLLPDWL